PPCRWFPLPRPGFPPQPAGSIAEKASDRKVELRHRMVRLPETAQLRAPAAPDSFARLPIAKRPAARQRLRPDAENFGGEGLFLTSLHIAQSPRRRSRLRPFFVHAPRRPTVNTEPLPCSLVTVTSPPIMRASLRVMARPSPVPPKR